jgi:hypothetical protein
MQAEPKFLGALTTTFTPPASCFGTTAAVGSDDIPFQMYTGGVAEADLVDSKYLHTECYPSGYPATGGDNFGAYFSPGVCPSGYTTAATMVDGVETRALCCLTGLLANDILGCTTSVTKSVLMATQFFTVAPGPLRPIETGVIKTGSSLLLIGSAIEIRFREGGNPAPTMDPQTTQSTTSYDTYVATGTGEGASFSKTRTTLSRVAPTTSRKGTSGGLSEGAKIGIGVSVPLIVLAAIVTGIVVFWRRRSARLRAARG